MKNIIIICLLLFSVQLFGSVGSDTIFVYENITEYDTVVIYDTLQYANNEHIVNIPSIKAIKVKSITATNLPSGIILNENNQNIKDMKKTTLAGIALILSNIAALGNNPNIYGKAIEDSIDRSHISQLKKDGYCSLSAGFGVSYGVLGLKYQVNKGNIYRYAFQVGIGVSPFAEDGILENTLFSVGAKYYPYKWFYLNPQFAIHLTDLKWFKSNIYKGFLIGGDWYFNSKIGINIGLGLLVGNGIDYMCDVGINYKF